MKKQISTMWSDEVQWKVQIKTLKVVESFQNLETDLVKN